MHLKIPLSHRKKMLKIKKAFFSARAGMLEKKSKKESMLTNLMLFLLSDRVHWSWTQITSNVFHQIKSQVLKFTNAFRIKIDLIIGPYAVKHEIK